MPEPRPGVVRYLVTPDLAEQRLDQALAALSRLSRRATRGVIDEGAVWLNAKPVRIASRLVTTGDVLDMVAEGPSPATPAPLPPPLAILHEDGWLIAVDKPFGVASQPPRQRRPGELTAQEHLLLQLAARDGQHREVLLFHRLDRITTGVLVFARQRDAARALTRIWASGEVDKRYLAVVRGDPGERPLVLAGAIAADPLVPGRFRVAARGRPARSEVRRLAIAGELALVEVHPTTGRTHQVRVHLADAGFPVVGDALYGGGGSAPRPFLHAWRLSLPHPHNGPLLRLVAPLPADLVAFLASRGCDVGAALPQP
ncbi:MAG: pseudouridine synthase [Thermoanaerobaculales bacterium]